MQAVPSLGFERLSTKLGIAGETPHICLHAVLLCQDFLGVQRLIQDRPAAEQLNRSLPAGGGPVNSVKNALAATIRHLWHSVILVVESDVKEQVLFLLIHPP